jgi:hypothetical protein
MIHWIRVIRDAVGIALLVGVGGLLVANIGGGGTGGIPMPHVAVSNFVLALIGFVIAGAMTREFRGRHLFLVAFFVWLLGFSSVLLLGITAVQWLASALAIFFACLFGGAIASALFRPQA